MESILQMTSCRIPLYKKDKERISQVEEYGVHREVSLGFSSDHGGPQSTSGEFQSSPEHAEKPIDLYYFQEQFGYLLNNILVSFAI